MDSHQGEQARRILIVDPGSLLAAGLAHLLGSDSQNSQGQVVVLQVASEDCKELADTMERFQPHLVILPDLNLSFYTAVHRALQKCTPMTRIIEISPECNVAFIQDLSQVELAGIDDLVALLRKR
jgi:DNA-binding NarL/FixJ family response regulator